MEITIAQQSNQQPRSDPAIAAEIRAGIRAGISTGITAGQSWRGLLSITAQPASVQADWAFATARRLALVAAIWAALTLAWIPIDLFALPGAAWYLIPLRLALAASFALIGWQPASIIRRQPANRLPTARLRRRILLLFLLQLAFVVAATAIIGASGQLADRAADHAMPGDLDYAGLIGRSTAIAERIAYAYQPLLLAAAIGLFALFLLDGLALALLICLVQVLIVYSAADRRATDWAGADAIDLGLFALLLPIAGIGMLAALSQASSLVAAIALANRDRLTQALTRALWPELRAGLRRSRSFQERQ